MSPALRTALLMLTLVSACAKGEAPSAQPAPPAATAEGKSERGPKAATATQIQALDQKKFGGAITERTSTPLTDLVKQPDRFTSQTVRTEGTVVAVCQSMGCWMEIGDESGQAHVKMAGHSFLIPKVASGHRAVVQGKVLPGSDMECGGKDNCREHAQEVTGQVAKVEIEATGVEFVD